MFRGAVRVLRKYSSEQLKKTALYDFHVANQGKMVPFAGYHMPVLYKNMGITESHMWCREHAALFDVSHMGQLLVHGEDRLDFLESLCPGNIKDLKVGNARLTQLTNENGGILDDTIITKKEDHVYMIINAACVDSDLKHMTAKLNEFSGDCRLEFIEDRSLLALQGPSAATILQGLVDYDLTEQAFMSSVTAEVGGISDCYIARCGYTGEDGFEISVPDASAVALGEMFLRDSECELAGLGPRDTLRLEAGLCLMGSDMNDTITPVEANLRFTLGKRRREEKSFPGGEIIMKQWNEGTDILRVGFKMDGRRVPREHYQICNENNDIIGEVTSGTLSPCLDEPIGMGYVTTDYSQEGTKIMIDIRGKLLPATVCAMPFVQQNYYRKPKK